MSRDSETEIQNSNAPTVTAEQIVEEMYQRVSALVNWLSINSTKKEGIKKAAYFLGITPGQVKSLVYRQSSRVDAHLCDQIRLRTSPVLNDINDAMKAFTSNNLREHGLVPANWTSLPTNQDQDC